MSYVYQYKIGTTYGGMVNLEELTTPVFAPKHSLIQASKPTILGDANVAALGWKITAWHWDYLTQAQYSQLRQFCSGLSAAVYINTRKNDGTYQVYTAIMLWPEEEPEFDNNKLLDITIRFRALVEYTP